MMRQRRTNLFFSFFLLFVLFSVPGFSDGCFFGYRDIEEPSQVGVILAERGEEDLILFVNARGDLEDFAWVVPVPSYPTVKEGDPDLFYDLSYITTYKPSPLYTCGTGNIVFAPGDAEGVHVWETLHVGIYETTILSSDDPSSLINWLNQNGYTFPEDAQPTIDYYIKRNYFFIAMKVERKEGIPPGYYMNINPIHIHFSTDKPIYPLKISSISAALSTEVLIYIFSNQPEEYPGFSREYSSYLTYKDYKPFDSIKTLLNGKSMYLTKLRATLSPSDMEEDVVFSHCRSSSFSLINTPLTQLFFIGFFGIILGYKIH